MNKNKIKLEEIIKTDAFKVPEGYFDTLTNDIMSILPEHARKEPIKINLWMRVQPWLYMAAMFVGIALMINIFVGTSSKKAIKTYASEGLDLKSSTEIEDFYHYYEDGLAKVAYDDMMANLSGETY
jgi:hypothetical protein